MKKTVSFFIILCISVTVCYAQNSIFGLYSSELKESDQNTSYREFMLISNDGYVYIAFVDKSCVEEMELIKTNYTYKLKYSLDDSLKIRFTNTRIYDSDKDTINDNFIVYLTSDNKAKLELEIAVRSLKYNDPYTRKQSLIRCDGT